jgi:hypothetical protein
VETFNFGTAAFLGVVLDSGGLKKIPIIMSFPLVGNPSDMFSDKSRQGALEQIRRVNESPEKTGQVSPPMLTPDRPDQLAELCLKGRHQ